jgi:hypothetical protein
MPHVTEVTAVKRPKDLTVHVPGEAIHSFWDPDTKTSTGYWCANAQVAMAICDIENDHVKAWACNTLNAAVLAEQKIEVAPQRHFYDPAYSENVAAVRDHFGTTSPIGRELLMHAIAHFAFDVLPPHAVSYLAHLHRERAAQEETAFLAA